MKNNENYKDGYEDIINMPHFISQKHPQMSMSSRAAQFAPFAALTGHGEEIKEEARITGRKIELDEYEVQRINEKLMYILRDEVSENKVKLIYFIEDKMKQGGRYVEAVGTIKKIDELNGVIYMEDENTIRIEDLIDVILTTSVSDDNIIL